MKRIGLPIPLPSFETVNHLLAYCPETGDLTRKVRIGRLKVGAIAGYITAGGYRSVTVNGCWVQAHRLAWLLFYGVDPIAEIDHINGVKTDNRILNLRIASKAENCRNRKLHRTNSSGYKGVSWHKKLSKWQATLNGKYLGYFVNKEDAVACVRAARTLAHGAFANHGA